MEFMIWIIAGAVILFAVWWIVKFAVSSAVPIEVSGQAYLKQELAKQGINPHTIPSDCIREFVDLAQKIASATTAPGSVAFRAEVVRTLDMIAFLFVLWVNDPDSGEFEEFGDHKNPYREIFERHGI